MDSPPLFISHGHAHALGRLFFVKLKYQFRLPDAAVATFVHRNM